LAETAPKPQTVKSHKEQRQEDLESRRRGGRPPKQNDKNQGNRQNQQTGKQQKMSQERPQRFQEERGEKRPQETQGENRENMGRNRNEKRERPLNRRTNQREPRENRQGENQHPRKNSETPVPEKKQEKSDILIEAPKPVSNFWEQRIQTQKPNDESSEDKEQSEGQNRHGKFFFSEMATFRFCKSKINVFFKFRNVVNFIQTDSSKNLNHTLSYL
jgi:hypothetical protein